MSRSTLAFLVCAVQAIACTTVDDNALEHALEASVGQPFARSRWGGPTVLRRAVREDNASSRIYDITYANGCSHEIVVRKADDIITSWRFTSSAALCKGIMHRSLGS